ncbi:hypothetical protein D3C80_1167660 [compost metagenome]
MKIVSFLFKGPRRGHHQNAVLREAGHDALKGLVRIGNMLDQFKADNQIKLVFIKKRSRITGFKFDVRSRIKSPGMRDRLR